MATKKDFTEYKLVVVGGKKVGKSSLIVQFVCGHFVIFCDTIIEDTYSKQCFIDEESVVLSILDTEGCDEFNAFTDHYMKMGEGFLLVYSITDRDSFLKILKLHTQILSVKDKLEFPMVLVANKADLETDRVVSYSEGEELAKTLKISYVEVSAKSGASVEKPFHDLVQTVRKCRKALITKRTKPAGEGKCIIL